MVKEPDAARSGRVAVLADASKLTVQAAPAWSALPDGWTLVTDAAGSEDLAQRCGAVGVGVGVVRGGARDPVRRPADRGAAGRKGGA